MACAHAGLSSLCVFNPIAMLASVSPSLHIVKMPVNSSLNQSSSAPPPCVTKYGSGRQQRHERLRQGC
eukprot:4450560-Pleurochrysis_carterae.AAC.1